MCVGRTKMHMYMCVGGTDETVCVFVVTCTMSDDCLTMIRGSENIHCNA